MDKSLLKEIILEQETLRSSFQLGIPREKLSAIAGYFSLPHSIVISGIRRSGKSTLLAQVMGRYRREQFYYFNFEDERLMSFGPEDFNVLYEIFIELFGERKVFFFDEVQNAPKWEFFVRRMQDAGHKFFLTGSNASLLSKELGSKLTGRAITTELYPFSFGEFLSFKEQALKKDPFAVTKERALLKKHFNDYLRCGGMPEFLRYNDPVVLKRVYEDILYRDIVVRHEIKEVKALRELSLYFLSNAASAFTYNSLKSILRLGSANTVKSYVDYLENSFLIFSINKFCYSLKKQFVAPKKIYCIDNGIIEAVAFQFSKNRGKFYENLAFLELKRRGIGDIYYYRTDDNQEVDFLIKQGSAVTSLIQVSESLNDEKTRARETNALLKAMRELKINKALILTYDTQENIKLENKTITVKPLYQWLLGG